VVNRRLLQQLAAEASVDDPQLSIEADLLKVVMADNAIEAVQEAVALCGNHALMKANAIERHLRDVLCARIHTPQADSALVAAGRARLGSPPR
jgi:alkylation response protein AidB-like acyl-CoA dehydrogenase